jgi:hypothetical protein
VLKQTRDVLIPYIDFSRSRLSLNQISANRFSDP